jgi:hypothetical protein
MKVLFAVTVAIAVPAAVLATSDVSSRTWWETTGTGAFPYSKTVEGATTPAAPPVWDAPPEQIWTHFESIAIYYTTAFGYNGQYIFAGSGNSSCSAQMFSTTGTGTPEWTVTSGDEVYTAGARDADAFAAAFTAAGENDVRFFKSGSSTPVWTYDPPSGELVNGELALPADGSFVATTFTAGNDTTLRVLDATNGSVIDSASTTNPHQRADIIVSPDGKFIMYRNGANLHVYEFSGSALTLRGTVPAGASTDCHSLSPDGKYVAFSNNESGFYTRRAAFDANGRLYIGWYRSDYKLARIVCHVLPTSTPEWTFDYNVVSGSGQELISGLAVTEDGRFLAASSWGNSQDLNPEIELFNGHTGDYLFGVNTPGSMADCDIAVSGDNCYATGGGKHVHFNTMGNSADIYSIHVANDVPVNGPDSFVARAAGAAVRVSWRGKWNRLAGFNLYRSNAASSRDESRTKLNGDLIKGQSPYSYVDGDVVPRNEYRYWLEAVDLSGERETFGPAEVKVPSRVRSFALYQNAPNPARGTTTFAFSLAESGPASLSVYDLAGREVWRRSDDFAAGDNAVDVTFDLAPGVYVYRLEAGSAAAARKMVVVK